MTCTDKISQSTTQYKLGGVAYAGIVDEDVEALLGEVVGGSLDRLEVLEVDLEEVQVEVLAGLRLHLFDGLLDTGRGAAGNVDAGIAESELLGGFVADAAVSYTRAMGKLGAAASK